jgi:HEAT repeat protein
MLPSDRDNAENPAHAIARQAMIAFSGAFKKLNLYSESHSVYTNALNTLKNSLEQHFSRFGNLNIRISRNQILCDDEVVYQGTAEPTDLVFILHRDGILSFEFQEGLELWELDTLLKILHDHCTLADDAEDDIVTALWKYNLPSILYEAADLELGLPDETRLFHQQGETQEKEGEGEEEGEEENCIAAETEADTADDDPRAASGVSPLERRNELFHLTPGEREQLRKMVFFEEQLDNTDYVVDVLLYILEQHSLPEDVDDLLGTLSQELGHALSKGRFAYLHTAIIKLEHHLKNLQDASHWSAPYMERFLGALSGHSFLNRLPALSSLIDESPPESLKELKKLLLLLDSKCITILGPMMQQTQSAALQRVLIATIAAMAVRDFSHLERLICDAEADLVPRLVFILGHLKDEASRQLLSNLLGHHSPAVRRQALKALLARDKDALEEVFALITDPDESIRKMVLQHFGRERNVRLERLLLRYLEAEAGNADDDLYLAMFRVLGRCGSDQSIHFLANQLFKWPLLGILRSTGSLRRRGALIALEGVNSTKAIHLAQRSAKGFWGNFLRPA